MTINDLLYLNFLEYLYKNETSLYRKVYIQATINKFKIEKNIKKVLCETSRISDFEKT